MSDPLRKCEICGEDFTLLHGRGANNRTACYACTSSSGYEPKKDRNKNLKRSYGLTLFGFGQMYAEQEGCCATCSTPLSFTGVNSRETKALGSGEPCVDHCHSTGRVRGILCWSCNVALGHVRDSVEVLSKMISYIQGPPCPIR